MAPEAATYSHSSDEEDDDMPDLVSANRVRQESILAEETVVVPPRSVTMAQIKPLAEIQDEPCAGEYATDPCLWFEPTRSLKGVRLPEGPIDILTNQVIISNESDEAIIISKGKSLGTAGKADI